MNRKSQLDNSVAGLRDEVVAEWYQEWELPQDTLGTVPFQQVVKPLTQLPGIIRHLLRPITNAEPADTPHSTVETESAV